MEVTYRIKRFDLVTAYFYNLRHSARTRLIVLGASALVFVLLLISRFSEHGRLLPSDVLYAFMWALVAILLIPALSYITAKTEQRILSIGEAGIETRIGNQTGSIPWKAVDSIAVAGDRIVITGKTANVFTIPARAFESDQDLQHFADLANQYRQTAR